MPGDWRRLAVIEMAPPAIGLASLATTPPPPGARLAMPAGSWPLGGGWVAATRAAVAAGREVCGVALTKKGESSGDLGIGIGNLVIDDMAT